MQAIVSKFIRFASEGKEFTAAASPYPQVVPDEFTADPMYGWAVSDGTIVEVKPVKAKAKTAAPQNMPPADPPVPPADPSAPPAQS